MTRNKPITAEQRERIVYLRNVRGCTNDAIAEDLGVNERTVGKYLTQLFREGTVVPKRRGPLEQSVWTEQRLADLERLWNLGHSASQIALAIGAGLTKNSIIGKARRLGLHRRPSPILSAPINPRPPRQEDRTMLMTPLVVPAPAIAPEPAPKPIHALDPLVPAKIRPARSSSGCQWPHGDPKDKASFGFCGKPTAPNPRKAPYCAHHFARAYQAAKPEKLEVAA